MLTHNLKINDLYLFFSSSSFFKTSLDILRSIEPRLEELVLPCFLWRLGVGERLLRLLRVGERLLRRLGEREGLFRLCSNIKLIE